MQLSGGIRSSKLRLSSSPAMTSTSVPQAVRARVVSEAVPLLTAHIACKSLWNALQMADYKKEGVLNDAAVTVLYNKERAKFTELLLITSSEDLQQLLDENEDGFLNEDEQLLMFSLVKERMQNTANELCEIHEYGMYRDMMKAIRLLEGDIVGYQEILRKRKHDKELTAYKEMGEEKLVKFEEDWNRRFEVFRQEAEARLASIKAKHTREEAELEAQLEGFHSPIGRLKAKTRNLLVEERLIAINERFNEAQKIHNEVKALEVEERTETAAEKAENRRKSRLHLARKHEIELRQAQLKLQTAENALKIRKEQQFSRLQKEIKLYLNDITKGQNLASRLARKMGETRDELRRTKQKAKEMMTVMSEAKISSRSKQRGRHSESVGTIGSLGSLPLLSTRATATLGNTTSGRMSIAASGYNSNSPLRQTLRQITKFGISTDTPGTDRPINSSSSLVIKTSSRSKFTAELIGQHTSKSTLRSLGELYNEELQVKELHTAKPQSEQDTFIGEIE